MGSPPSCGFSNGVLKAVNVDFRQVIPAQGQVTADGQLLIGAAAAPYIRPGSLTSTGGSITVTPGPGTLNIEAADAFPDTFVTDAGTATPALGILDVFGGTSVGGASTNINTIGSGNQVSVCLNNSISQPTSNAAGTTGLYNLGGQRFLHNYAATGLAGNNSFLGKSSGNLTLTGTNDSGVGAASLSSLTTGSSNTAFGSGSLPNITSGSNNISVGAASGGNLSAAESSNICIGNAGTLGESNAIHLGTQGGGAGQQNKCFVAGVASVAVANTNMVTIDTATGQMGSAIVPAGIMWHSVTSAANPTVLTANNGYTPKGVGVVQFDLPASAAFGDTFYIAGYGNLWTISQNAGQSITLGIQQSSIGVSGSVSATQVRDSCTILCTVANSEFQIINSTGNLNFV